MLKNKYKLKKMLEENRFDDFVELVSKLVNSPYIDFIDIEHWFNQKEEEPEFVGKIVIFEDGLFGGDCVKGILIDDSLSLYGHPYVAIKTKDSLVKVPKEYVKKDKNGKIIFY